MLIIKKVNAAFLGPPYPPPPPKQKNNKNMHHPTCQLLYSTKWINMTPHNLSTKRSYAETQHLSKHQKLDLSTKYSFTNLLQSKKFYKNTPHILSTKWSAKKTQMLSENRRNFSLYRMTTHMVTTKRRGEQYLLRPKIVARHGKKYLLQKGLGIVLLSSMFWGPAQQIHYKKAIHLEYMINILTSFNVKVWQPDLTTKSRCTMPLGPQNTSSVHECSMCPNRSLL